VEEAADRSNRRIGFVDDYTRLTVGNSVEENIETLLNLSLFLLGLPVMFNSS
jgi:hypothetical protein